MRQSGEGQLAANHKHARAPQENTVLGQTEERFYSSAQEMMSILISTISSAVYKLQRYYVLVSSRESYNAVIYNRYISLTTRTCRVAEGLHTLQHMPLSCELQYSMTQRTTYQSIVDEVTPPQPWEISTTTKLFILKI